MKASDAEPMAVGKGAVVLVGVIPALVLLACGLLPFYRGLDWQPIVVGVSSLSASAIALARMRRPRHSGTH